FGLVSYLRLPLNLFPDLTYPTLTVRTEYPGAAPEEVENQVCRLLEEELSTIPSLVEITSISRAELGDVVLEFDWDTNMDGVSQMVRERLARMTLPDEARRPILLRYDPSLDPILRIGLSGGDDLYLLRHVADEQVSRELETIPGVAAVKVRGGLVREISIELDPGRMAVRGLVIDDISRRLAAENVNLSGGSIKEGDTEYLIRTLAEFHGVDEIAEVLIPCPDGTPTRLGDIASVSATHREREVVGHIDGEESVEIRIYREADANIVTVSRRVKDALFGSAAQRRYLAMLEMRTGGGEAGSDSDSETDPDPDPDPDPDSDFDPTTDPMYRQMSAFLANQLPDGVELHLVGDQSAFIEDSLNDVRGGGAIGGLMAVLIIFLFLRDVWSTLIISLAIPLSVVITFTPMFLAGVSLNLMSLGGLALGIGMLVDSSIVVLESIFRCREEGDGPRAAAIRGAREVAAAVAASTFTTVAVFFPIVFVKGVAGQLFGNLALTVVFSLLASLAVALFLIPMLAAWRLDAAPRPATRLLALQAYGPRAAWRQMRASMGGLVAWARRSRGPIRFATRRLAAVPGFGYLIFRFLAMLPLSLLALLFGFAAGLFLRISVAIYRLAAWGGGGVFGVASRGMDAGQNALQRAYLGLLGAALTHRVGVLLLASLLLVGALELASRLGQELIPTVSQGEFDVELALPVGTPLEETLGVLDVIETRVAEVEGVERLLATAGTERTADSESGKGEHTIDLHVRVAPDGARIDRAEAKVTEDLRRRLGSIPGLSVRVRQPTLFSFRAPVEVAIFGHDLGTLRRQTWAAVDALASLDALQDVRTDLQPGFPELRLRYDREQLSARGLDIFQVARAVRDKVEGSVATDLRGRDDRIDVRVRLQPERVMRVDDVRRLNVNPAGYPPIQLQTVAKLELDEGPSEIRHIDQRRAGVVTAGLEGFDLGGASVAIDRELRALEWPPEFEYDVRGQSREMEVSLTSLRFALALAVFLVYVIMATTFESFRHPFVILFSIPLAIVGVVPVLALLDISMSVLVLIGAIVLAGIVVNNAIV
ncbi:MAG: efflux RND transporter permease subunit, partial [Myxococcota bacterium]|nr:efflux RND transporter permease subunit [Myxococcota bacterium]